MSRGVSRGVGGGVSRGVSGDDNRFARAGSFTLHSASSSKSNLVPRHLAFRHIDARACNPSSTLVDRACRESIGL